MWILIYASLTFGGDFSALVPHAVADSVIFQTHEKCLEELHRRGIQQQSGRLVCVRVAP